MGSKAKRGWESRLALHWFTYFVHVHGKQPLPATGRFERTVLREIYVWQSHRDEARALALIEQIVHAPAGYIGLFHRYAALWAWTEMERPRKADPSLALLDDCLRRILVNAKAAA